MLGAYQPIWLVVIIEFCLAYLLEMFMGSPCSFRLAMKVFDPRKNHPMLFETAIICATVGLMCPAMSLIASALYYPYYAGFSVLTLLANWIKLMCVNFPFAFFTQLFFIQPFVRTVFKVTFRKDIKKRAELAKQQEQQGKKLKPQNEVESIEDVMKRIEEINVELKEEYGKLKEKNKNQEVTV